MNLDSLEKLADDDLRAVIARSEVLLKQHNSDRKEKALAEARATLAAVGLTLKDLGGKKPAKKEGWKPTRGRIYQHPDDAAKKWNGRGPRPGWMNELIASSRQPREM